MTVWPVRPILYADDVDEDTLQRVIAVLDGRLETVGWVGGELARVDPEDTGFGTHSMGAYLFVEAPTGGEAANLGLSLLEQAFRDVGVTPRGFCELCIEEPSLRGPERP